MKHVTIELKAIDEIVGNRFLQSAEFEQGAALVGLLTTGNQSILLPPKLRATEAGDGIFITTKTIGSDAKFLVIDVEQSKIFDGMSPQDTLFSFQKLVRFAKKAWQGLALNFSERMIPQSTKAVVFPFREFKQAPYRITVERDPMPERLSKRGHKGNFLLAYKAGHEGGDAIREVAELTNFRKAYEAIIPLRQTLQTLSEQPADSNAGIDQLEVVKLPDADEFGTNSMYRRFEEWLPMLTTQQQRFVHAPIAGPYRIEGAAGTGKTLCLILKAIYTLREAKVKGLDCHLVFITHSDATKRNIAEVISVIDSDGFADFEKDSSERSIKVCTLSELCAEQLRQSISESEFIDRDAMGSKDLQLLYISEAYDEAMQSDFSSHERFLSPAFAQFLRSEDSWKVVEMLQHEISVVIKGRAAEDFERYKKIEALRYGLPVASSADKGFVFTVFRLYQERLGQVGQFDTDDVVLTAIGQLDTPIWRRRRSRDGFDAVIIDETHLFNINELHLFHYFTKSEGPYPIVYSVDRSQAVGDRGWTSSDIAESLAVGDGPLKESEAQVRTIFRSSPDIVNLAFSIVSSGATLFTNFDNPMDITASGFTEEEEVLSVPPVYLNVANDEVLVEAAFARAEALYKEMGCRRSDILIVTLDETLLERLAAYAIERNKPHLVLKKRGDALAVQTARQSAQVILAHADYVGGLEFYGVVIAGVDRGRVPQTTSEDSESSKNFLSYAAHNRLYVAVSRAKYRIELIGEKSRGPSKIIEPAITGHILSVREF